MTNNESILPENIKRILTKYYDGHTSLEEERLLRKYFAENPISDSNLTYKTLLSFGTDNGYHAFPSDEIWKKIKDKERAEQKQRKSIKIISSIVASIIVVLSIGVLCFYPVNQENRLTDSYSNPEDAYKAVQKYLGFVSSRLSYAYMEMKPIEKLSIPSEAMQPFSSIDQSFQRLKLFNRIGVTTRELECFSTISDIIVVDNN